MPAKSEIMPVNYASKLALFSLNLASNGVVLCSICQRKALVADSISDFLSWQISANWTQVPEWWTTTRDAFGKWWWSRRWSSPCPSKGTSHVPIILNQCDDNIKADIKLSKKSQARTYFQDSYRIRTSRRKSNRDIGFNAWSSGCEYIRFFSFYFEMYVYIYHVICRLWIA